MTFTPPTGPMIRATEHVDVHQVQSRKRANVIPIVVILFGLISGIILVAAGIGIGGVANLWTSGLGVLLVVGIIFLAASVGARYMWLDDYLPEVSIALALYVAIEFLAGAALAYIGFANLAFGRMGVDWVLVVFTAFGLFLVGDSMIFYRKAFKRSTRE